MMMYFVKINISPTYSIISKIKITTPGSAHLLPSTWSPCDPQHRKHQHIQLVRATGAYHLKLEEAPLESTPSFWALPVGGGDVEACPEGFGHLYLKPQV